MKKLKKLIGLALALAMLLPGQFASFAVNPSIQTGIVDLSLKQSTNWKDKYGVALTAYPVTVDSNVKVTVLSVVDKGTSWDVTYATSGYLYLSNSKYTYSSYSSSDAYVRVNSSGNLQYASYSQDNNYKTLNLNFNQTPANKQMTINVPKCTYKTDYSTIIKYDRYGDPVYGTMVDKDFGLKLEFRVYANISATDDYNAYYANNVSMTVDQTFTFNMNNLPDYSVSAYKNYDTNGIYLSGSTGWDQYVISGKAWDKEGWQPITAKIEMTCYDSTAGLTRKITKSQVISSPPATAPPNDNYNLVIDINVDKFDGTVSFADGKAYGCTLTITDGYDTKTQAMPTLYVDKTKPTVTLSTAKALSGGSVTFNSNSTGVIYLVKYGTYTADNIGSEINDTTGTKKVIGTTGSQTMIAPLTDGYYRAFVVDRANNISDISPQTVEVDNTKPVLISAVLDNDNIILNFDSRLNTTAPSGTDFFAVVNTVSGGLKTIVADEESLESNVFYDDYEGDSLHSESYLYLHDETYFENSNGKASFSGVKRSTAITNFSNVGLYTLTYSVRDNPLNKDEFDEYRLSSKTVSMQFLVHRRPVANFSMSSLYVPATGKNTISITDSSLDLDHESASDKGIVAWAWEWRDTTSSTWTTGKPTTLTPGKIYDVALMVKDYEGAWSVKTIKQISPSTTDNNTPPQINFKSISPAAPYEGDDINLVALPSDPDGDILSVQYFLAQPGGAYQLINTYTNLISGQNLNLPKIQSSKAGQYMLKLIVSDGKGGVAQTEASIWVNAMSVNATLLPGDPMAGDVIYFNISTNGFVDKVEVVPDSSWITEDKRVLMGYKPAAYTDGLKPGDAYKALLLEMDESKLNDVKQLKYQVWVTVPQTLTLKKVRLRPIYNITIRAWKGSVYRDFVLQTEIEGSVLQTIKMGTPNK